MKKRVHFALDFARSFCILSRTYTSRPHQRSRKETEKEGAIRKRDRDWNGPIHVGHFLSRSQPASLLSYILFQHSDPHLSMPILILFIVPTILYSLKKAVNPRLSWYFFMKCRGETGREASNTWRYCLSRSIRFYLSRNSDLTWISSDGKERNEGGAGVSALIYSDLYGLRREAWRNVGI